LVHHRNNINAERYIYYSKRKSEVQWGFDENQKGGDMSKTLETTTLEYKYILGFIVAFSVPLHGNEIWTAKIMMQN
jgi:hypothetical protein